MCGTVSAASSSFHCVSFYWWPMVVFCIPCISTAEHCLCLSSDPAFLWGSVASSSLKLNIQLLVCWGDTRLAAYLMCTCPKLECKRRLVSLLWVDLSRIVNVRPNEAKTHKETWGELALRVGPRDIWLDSNNSLSQCDLFIRETVHVEIQSCVI